MSRRTIAAAGVASACYFRTSTADSDRKALIQITERCNLHCAHCFVSATREGIDMDLARIEDELLPRLTEAQVSRVTLTGGEPFAHPDLMEIIGACRRAGMTVTVCTNGTLIDTEAIEDLAVLGGVKLNVSLDGFSAASHGKFRGSPESFETTRKTMRALGEAGLLKGVLVTPNRLAPAEEYEALCNFAISIGAEYVLMNPLSSLGRGVGGARRLAASEEVMRAVALETAAHEEELELVRVRFPNESRPLSACEAGRILYVFADGSLTVCPYLVFAARTPSSRHEAGEFIVGNALADADIATRLARYPLEKRVRVRSDPTCDSCALSGGCGRGCPAAVIAAGGTVGERDREQCPIEDAA
ncbi:MAG TPA: radical SAM protein [Solirubrobacterales bacterium]|nr:radical SAM protein [Solirubrobacterales bacterium]